MRASPRRSSAWCSRLRSDAGVRALTDLYQGRGGASSRRYLDAAHRPGSPRDSWSPRLGSACAAPSRVAPAYGATFASSPGRLRRRHNRGPREWWRHLRAAPSAARSGVELRGRVLLVLSQAYASAMDVDLLALGRRGDDVLLIGGASDIPGITRLRADRGLRSALGGTATSLNMRMARAWLSGLEQARPDLPGADAAVADLGRIRSDAPSPGHGRRSTTIRSCGSSARHGRSIPACPGLGRCGNCATAAGHASRTGSPPSSRRRWPVVSADQPTGHRSWSGVRCGSCRTRTVPSTCSPWPPKRSTSSPTSPASAATRPASSSATSDRRSASTSEQIQDYLDSGRRPVPQRADPGAARRRCDSSPVAAPGRQRRPRDRRHAGDPDPGRPRRTAAGVDRGRPAAQPGARPTQQPTLPGAGGRLRRRRASSCSATSSCASTPFTRCR